MKLDGSLVPNEDVIIRIKKLTDTEFNAASAGRFGYEYATHELKKEYLINKKKAAAARCTGLCLPMAFY
jgi:putative transposase